MRYSRALFAAALALSAAACDQSTSTPTDPALAPAGPSYSGGVGWGGGQFADTTKTVSGSPTTAEAATVDELGSGEDRGVQVGVGH